MTRSPRSRPRPTSTTSRPTKISQDALDLDSMDFLNFLIALSKSTGVEIPESDSHLVRTRAGCRDYLLRHAAS